MASRRLSRFRSILQFTRMIIKENVKEVNGNFIHNFLIALGRWHWKDSVAVNVQLIIYITSIFILLQLYIKISYTMPLG